MRESNFKLKAIYSDYDIIDSNNNLLHRNKSSSIPKNEFRFHMLSGKNLINGCTVLIHKNIFEKIGLFNENLPTIQDFEMWCRMAEHFEFSHQPEFLIKSRFHDEQGIVTIESHFSEKESFLCDSIKNIDRENLRLISGEKSVATAYAKLAIKSKNRNISQSSILASKLARQYILNDDILTILKNIILVSYCEAYNTIVRVLNKLNLIDSHQNRFILKRKKQLSNWKKKNIAKSK